MKNHGCHPFGNAKARAVVWNFPDPVPLHREPLFSPRPDLIDKYPTHDDQKNRWRMPVLFKTVQQANKDAVKQYPLIMTSGRLVEYEGGGEETRSNPWLAELQQEMFVEINPKDANDRGVKNDEYVWVETPTKARLKVKTQVTERVASGTVFLPFHFSGWYMGKDLLDNYPEGAAPDRARRSGQYRDDLWLRHRDHDAGNQDHAVPDQQSGIARQREPRSPTWQE